MADVNSGDILSLCKRRGFIYPSYEIYGGIAGLFDYGPLGCTMKTNVMNQWRRIYALEEGFLEIDGETIGPEAVFKASGHVDNFADLIVSCVKCEESFRADHLCKELHPNPGALPKKELEELICKNGVVCTSCGGELSHVEEFNLMFKTKIGPGKGRVGYLRPETAQGIFVNFANLYRHARERLPFGVIQIGRGYRNEISPRQGVIRMREFNMMEAELFVDPLDKRWPAFDSIKDTKVTLVPNSYMDTDEKTEVVVETTFGKAVEDKIIAHQTIGYFLWVTQRFLTEAGVDPARLRFRQHLKTEMAHYACDCWDAEALLSYGWTEITGIADRGSWDLSRHIQFSNADLTAFKRFDEPTEVEKDVIKAKFGVLGPEYKGKAKKVATALEQTEPSKIVDGRVTVDVDGEMITLEPKYYEVVRVKEKVNGEKVVPHVIEPSHGLDRILYTCLEHAYSVTPEGYVTMKLRTATAPIKVGVFPLMSKDDLDKIAMDLDVKLRRNGITTAFDDSGSIGRRYARMDEVGTPYCITVDYEAKEKNRVTIRDRDTTQQKWIPLDDVVKDIESLLSGTPFSALKGEPKV
jgi:glycyl-tRNA synthetase